ncbi:MAG: helix-turn-helix transcriptional regulator [Clostridia bacterium]|nr:helix-turn-helix transcriptional regulator [Clostridia bacterium]
MKLVEAISKRVSVLLDQKDYTLYKLQKEGGVPRSTVSDVILVKKKRISTDTIYQICMTLGITLKEFFDDSIFSEVTD